MTDKTSVPFVPFNPREVGPIDVAKSAYRRATGFLSENSRVLIAATVAVIVAAWHFDVSVPEIPNWVLVGAFASAFAFPIATWFGWQLAKGIDTRDTELLAEVNPKTGDIKLINIAPERFQDMTVTNQNEEQRDRDFLHVITVNGRRAYEVDGYDPEKNLAVASWQAGTSNAEIRRQKKSIDRIKTKLERESDKSLELLANHPEILRSQLAEVSNRLIRVSEDVEVPGGEALHETLSESLEENDPSSDLLSDRDDFDTRREEDDEHDGDDRDADDGDETAAEKVASIFERAAEGGATTDD
jgi:hypothetical protein